MRRSSVLVCVLLLVAVLLGPGAANAFAQQYQPDKNASGALTGYLKEHKLPLVGAQVSAAPDGSRRVLLYGFVASDFGRADAQSKVAAYLNDPKVTIVNRITVDPQIAAQEQAGTSAAPAPSPDEEWNRVMENILRYDAKTPPEEETDLNTPP